MIPPIKKILYATDLSKNSIYAFYYAVDMAKKYGAEISILHVIEPVSSKAFGSRTDKVLLDQQNASMEVIRKRLQRFCEKVGQRNGLSCMDLVAKVLVQVGDPVDEILKAAGDGQCDLIFLGDHSKGVLAQTLLGSVSRAVLDRARKPVFLIPLPTDDTIAWDEI
jgi:nucleotide-binding universal stress UspA family protein